MPAPLALLTSAQSRQAEQQSGVDGAILMERAGLLAARMIIRDYPACRVHILAGPGNNGGDGFVVARYLREAGFQPCVFTLGAAAKRPAEAQQAAERWRGGTQPLSLAALDAPLLIDGLFGAGLARPISGLAAELAEKTAAGGCSLVALDMPSGVLGDDGSIDGAAFRAERTIAFATARPGHLLFPGRAHCGEVSVADIGISGEVIAGVSPHYWWNRLDLWQGDWPQLALEGHKYQRGHVLVAGGGLARAGASRMAARTALRAGAGAVSLIAPPQALAAHAAAGAGLMLEELAGAKSLTESLKDTRKNVVLLGPGLGRGKASRDLVMAAMASHAILVLDADALTSFAGDTKPLFTAIAKRKAPTLCTPHEGEYRALFPNAPENAPKLARALEGAKASGAYILLKGADSIIAAPSGGLAISNNAPPWLATAGAGDVLAGLAAGLLAQGMEVFSAAAAASWLLGAAANHKPAGLTAEDLPCLLAKILPSS